MRRSADRILTTHGGRLPSPAVMQELDDARTNGDAASGERLTRAGIVEVLRTQIATGIDIVSDGEFYKFGTADSRYYATRFTGIEERPAEADEATWFGGRSPEMRKPEFARFFEYMRRVDAPCPDSDTGPRPGFFSVPGGKRCVITGPLEYLGRGAIEHDLQIVRSGLDEAGVSVEDVFYPVVGPNWLSHFLWNEYYPTEEEYVYALAEAMRGEYQAVVDAGFVLQVDDPALADKFGMFDPPISVAAYRKHQELRVEATNHAIRGIPEERIRFHVCWGSWHFPHTTDIGLEDIIDLIFRVNAQGYSIEAANVRHQLDYKIWERDEIELPDGKILIPGVISHATSNLVETPEVVADRIVRYARLVGPENVIAGVDCGPGRRCHDDVAWAKLRALTDGAERASRELWGG
jgi:5-methyltetrahydropteroyltriglutamate--homocysteine methyltransferase